MRASLQKEQQQQRTTKRKKARERRKFTLRHKELHREYDITPCGIYVTMLYYIYTHTRSRTHTDTSQERNFPRAKEDRVPRTIADQQRSRMASYI
ncbi:unnamed protein product [Trichogramma brassicae]|uniref:Uncharacterized protein n=1 Tax=Trichogramma brassicae TaxID=86971 RepID=A0A6H5HUI4_9HYME|nr:unnamed protein product [Trichogramma brassicae]